MTSQISNTAVVRTVNFTRYLTILLDYFQAYAETVGRVTSVTLVWRGLTPATSAESTPSPSAVRTVNAQAWP